MNQIAVASALIAAVLTGCSAGHGPRAATPLHVAWRWQAPKPASVGMPASDGTDVAATSGHHLLVVLDATGQLRWQQQLVGLRDVAPAFTPADVLVATDDGVAGFARSTGERRWITPLGQRPSTPLVAAGRALVATWEGNVFALALADGRVAWSRPLPGASLGPPALVAGSLVATWESEDGSGAGAVALDAITGAPRWAVALPPGGVSAPAAVAASDQRRERSSARAGPTWPERAGELVVTVAGDGRVHALEAATGAERWAADVSGAGSPEVPPAPVAGGVVVADQLTGLGWFGSGGRRQWFRPGPGAVVRGGPVVTGTDARNAAVALPLDAGGVLVVAPGGRTSKVLELEGRVSGLAMAGRRLIAATRGGVSNALVAFETRKISR